MRFTREKSCLAKKKMSDVEKKRGRGRPKRLKNLYREDAEAVANGQVSLLDPTKRKAGRPKKVVDPEVNTTGKSGSLSDSKPRPRELPLKNPIANAKPVAQGGLQPPTYPLNPVPQPIVNDAGSEPISEQHPIGIKSNAQNVATASTPGSPSTSETALEDEPKAHMLGREAEVTDADNLPTWNMAAHSKKSTSQPSSAKSSMSDGSVLLKQAEKEAAGGEMDSCGEDSEDSTSHNAPITPTAAPAKRTRNRECDKLHAPSIHDNLVSKSSQSNNANRRHSSKRSKRKVSNRNYCESDGGLEDWDDTTDADYNPKFNKQFEISFPTVHRPCKSKMPGKYDSPSTSTTSRQKAKSVFPSTFRSISDLGDEQQFQKTNQVAGQAASKTKTKLRRPNSTTVPPQLQSNSKKLYQMNPEERRRHCEAMNYQPISSREASNCSSSKNPSATNEPKLIKQPQLRLATVQPPSSVVENPRIEQPKATALKESGEAPQKTSGFSQPAGTSPVTPVAVQPSTQPDNNLQSDNQPQLQKTRTESESASNCSPAVTQSNTVQRSIQRTSNMISGNPLFTPEQEERIREISNSVWKSQNLSATKIQQSEPDAEVSKGTAENILASDLPPTDMLSIVFGPSINITSTFTVSITQPNSETHISSPTNKRQEEELGETASEEAGVAQQMEIPEKPSATADVSPAALANTVEHPIEPMDNAMIDNQSIVEEIIETDEVQVDPHKGMAALEGAQTALLAKAQNEQTIDLLSKPVEPSTEPINLGPVSQLSSKTLVSSSPTKRQEEEPGATALQKGGAAQQMESHKQPIAKANLPPHSDSETSIAQPSVQHSNNPSSSHIPLPDSTSNKQRRELEAPTFDGGLNSRADQMGTSEVIVSPNNSEVSKHSTAPTVMSTVPSLVQSTKSIPPCPISENLSPTLSTSRTYKQLGFETLFLSSRTNRQEEDISALEEARIAQQKRAYEKRFATTNLPLHSVAVPYAAQSSVQNSDNQLSSESSHIPPPTSNKQRTELEAPTLVGGLNSSADKMRTKEMIKSRDDSEVAKHATAPTVMSTAPSSVQSTNNIPPCPISKNRSTSSTSTTNKQLSSETHFPLSTSNRQEEDISALEKARIAQQKRADQKRLATTKPPHSVVPSAAQISVQHINNTPSRQSSNIFPPNFTNNKLREELAAPTFVGGLNSSADKIKTRVILPTNNSEGSNHTSPPTVISSVESSVQPTNNIPPCPISENRFSTSTTDKRREKLDSAALQERRTASNEPSGLPRKIVGPIIADRAVHHAEVEPLTASFPIFSSGSTRQNNIAAEKRLLNYSPLVQQTTRNTAITSVQHTNMEPTTADPVSSFPSSSTISTTTTQNETLEAQHCARGRKRKHNALQLEKARKAMRMLPLGELETAVNEIRRENAAKEAEKLLQEKRRLQEEFYDPAWLFQQTSSNMTVGELTMRNSNTHENVRRHNTAEEQLAQALNTQRIEEAEKRGQFQEENALLAHSQLIQQPPRDMPLGGLTNHSVEHFRVNNTVEEQQSQALNKQRAEEAEKQRLFKGQNYHFDHSFQPATDLSTVGRLTTGSKNLHDLLFKEPHLYAPLLPNFSTQPSNVTVPNFIGQHNQPSSSNAVPGTNSYHSFLAVPSLQHAEQDLGNSLSRPPSVQPTNYLQRSTENSACRYVRAASEVSEVDRSVFGSLQTTTNPTLHLDPATTSIPSQNSDYRPLPHFSSLPPRPDVTTFNQSSVMPSSDSQQYQLNLLVNSLIPSVGKNIHRTQEHSRTIPYLGQNLPSSSVGSVVNLSQSELMEIAKKSFLQVAQTSRVTHDASKSTNAGEDPTIQRSSSSVAAVTTPASLTSPNADPQLFGEQIHNQFDLRHYLQFQ